MDCDFEKHNTNVKNTKSLLEYVRLQSAQDDYSIMEKPLRNRIGDRKKTRKRRPNLLSKTQRLPSFLEPETRVGIVS